MAGEPERQRGCRPSCSGRPLVEGIASIDLFVVPTIAFQQLFAFLVLGHKRRQLLWFAVTRNPTAEWLARQITEAFAGDVAAALSESHTIVTGKRLTWPNRYSTAATIRSRTFSPAMPPVVASKLMASRSQQSSANAIRTRSPCRTV